MERPTKVAFITQGGRNSVMKTEDGGKTWRHSYDGIYGDTVNALNLIESGLLKGSLVITAVSGIEITQNHGDTWMEGVDFVLGRSTDKNLPGYSWRAVSPDTKVKGRYDLLISTGYPSPFREDGVFGVDISCVRSGGKNCSEKLVEGPHYDMVIMNGKLYAGNLDGGIDMLDLTTLKSSKLYVTGKDPVLFVKVFDGRIFVETYRGQYQGDCWMWTGKSGEVYVLEDNGFKRIYDEYVITFLVRNGAFLALKRGALIYKPTLDSPAVEIELPKMRYTNLVVDWDEGWFSCPQLMEKSTTQCLTRWLVESAPLNPSTKAC